jgi:5-methylthioadenosine/S-adenosylhomocysteine deaminase
MDEMHIGEQDGQGRGSRPSTRRGFLGAAVTVGALGVTGIGSTQATAQAATKDSGLSKPVDLPKRRNIVIRGAYVITMDRDLGDMENTDIHINNGAIVAVGVNLPARGAEEINGRGMIVLPGLVDTHWHLWTALLRSLSGDTAARGYFPLSTTLGKAYQAHDMYTGGLLAAAEALTSGITFVHDWCHNIRGPEYANESVRALVDSGLRGRFSYGHAAGLPIPQSIDLVDMERLHNEWATRSGGGRFDLGMAWRGMRFSGVPRPASVYQTEFDTARRLGLPISTHANIVHGLSDGEIADLVRNNLLGPDVQVIHATNVTPEEIQGMAGAKAVVSFSPCTELRAGFGLPPTSEVLDAGIPVGLSIDTTALSGNADMFGVMKLLQNVAKGRAQNEFLLPARRVLELATIAGARTMGVGDRVGSLVAGKRADVIMIDTNAVNIGPFSDAARLVVEAAQPANVDTVIVDGRVLKQRGRLTSLDTRRILRDATTALARLRTLTNW